MADSSYTIDNLSTLSNLTGDSLLLVRKNGEDYRYPISSLINTLLYTPSLGSEKLGAPATPFKVAYIKDLNVAGALNVTGATTLIGELNATGNIKTPELNASIMVTAKKLTVKETSTFQGDVTAETNINCEDTLTSSSIIAIKDMKSPTLNVGNLKGYEGDTSDITLNSNLTQEDKTKHISSELFKGTLTSKTSDGKLKLYVDGDNEINFGGTAAGDTIYFGKEPRDSKTAIPSTYIFGNTEKGTATLKAANLNCSRAIEAPAITSQSLEVNGPSTFDGAIEVESKVGDSGEEINTITAPKFIGLLEGDVNGNATSASRWKEGRTLTVKDTESVISGSAEGVDGSKDIEVKLILKDATTSLHGLLSADDKKKLDTLLDYRTSANTWSNKQAFTSSGTVNASSAVGDGAINITASGIVAAGGIKGSKVYNAVWNDLADCIPVDGDCELIYGYCYCFDGKRYYRSRKYLDDGIIGIHSDTYGMHMGYKRGLKQMNVAVAGFALAYVDKEYAPGTALTCGENGYLTEILAKDRIEHPEKIVATYWKKETEDYWGSANEKVVVGGRTWVRIR